MKENRTIKHSVYILITLPFVFCGSIQAAALGMPTSTARIGYVAGITQIAIDDPVGSTNRSWQLQPLGLAYSDWFIRGTRYWGEAYYQETEADADPNNIGQFAQHLGARLLIQKDLEISRAWMPWFGLGLDLSHTKYSKRHSIDAEGYLLQRYANRNETSLSLVANMMTEWAIGRDWDIGVKVEQLIPLGNGFSSTSLSALLMYRY